MADQETIDSLKTRIKDLEKSLHSATEWKTEYASRAMKAENQNKEFLEIIKNLSRMKS